MRSLLLTACLSLVLSAQAADVYRWTDENGQVHFGQRPPAAGAQRMELPDAGTLNTYGGSELQQRRDRERRLLDNYEYDRDQKRARQAREESKRQTTAANCRKLQEYWQQLSYQGPIYIRRDGGGRDYLSDEQRVAEKARIEPAYERACGRKP